MGAGGQDFDLNLKFRYELTRWDGDPRSARRAHKPRSRGLKSTETWQRWEPAGYEAPGWAEGYAVAKAKGVRSVVKRRPLKVGKLSYEV